MKNPTIKAALKNIKKDGTAKIYIRLTIERKSKLIPTNILVNAKNFDKSKGIILNVDEKAAELNYLISVEKRKLEDMIIELQISKNPINFDSIIDNDEGNRITFVNYAIKVMEIKKHLYKSGTLRKNKSDITKFKNYNENLLLINLDFDELRAYEKYMYTELKNKTNTVAKSFSFVRMILNYAEVENRIKNNPFNKYQIKKAPTHRVFLQLDDLKKLEKQLDKTTNEKIKNTIKAFLFGCHTGLRYTDIKTLSPNDIFEDKLLLQQEKTSEQILIPLTDFAKKLIDFKTKKINFQLYSNQKLNTYLKEIDMLPHKVTFHSARHTFATVGIELGIPIEIISKLLGHNSIKTTQIYAKIVDNKKVEEMEKFNW